MLPCLIVMCLLVVPAPQDDPHDERSPSIAYYFDWINSQYEGTTEEHALINLDFWAWMRAEYGFELDVYCMDVGNVDDGAYTAGVGRLIPHHYGTLANEEFKAQFPRGLGPLAKRAAVFGCRLGMWLGPDGFGDTEEEERARTCMMISLCRDHNLRMFKLDAVAGQLREEKQAALARALVESRKICPDLVVLNERVDLGLAEPQATTSLWEGEETYIDVFSSNRGTAPHHRAGTLERPNTPGLTRLIEDHGVCLSSCLDYWEDDLVLQTFGRALILAPEIYGSPWFLRDLELARLARLCNLYRRYRAILVDGMELPNEQYGPHAMARGDGSRRFLTLRNLTWEPVVYRVQLDSSIGLAGGEQVELQRLHPFERVLGTFRYGEEVGVRVEPFRACLMAATTRPLDEVTVVGCEYEVVRDTPGAPILVDLLGLPGTTARVRAEPGSRGLESWEFDVEFPGRQLSLPWHRALGPLEPCGLPFDAEALFEATCFAADSNALEVRSLDRSGPSENPVVQRARAAFLEQPMFVNRGIWDWNLFDGDTSTFFISRLEDRALRVDFGAVLEMDRIVIRIRDREAHDIAPKADSFAQDAVLEISADLMTWQPLEEFSGKGTIVVAKLPRGTRARYLRIDGPPLRVAEVEAYQNGVPYNRAGWRASNLFHAYRRRPAVAAWSKSFSLPEIPPGSYLAVALEGKHGDEGAYAAMRVDGQPVGAPDRAVSFPSNTWEYKNVEKESGYTYFLPLEAGMAGKKLEVFVLGLKGGQQKFKPEVYVTAYPPPLARHRIEF
ncbi:MAG: hypothetical protein V2A76_10880 [Planctomycetota bacterium]